MQKVTIEIDGKQVEFQQLENGKWTLPTEIKESRFLTCGALDIENNRIGIESIITNGNSKGFSGGLDKVVNTEHTGRFPSQTFIDSNTKEILDGQSGIDNRSDQRRFKSKGNVTGKETIYESGFKPIISTNYNDTNGCSKSVHICDYEKGEYDIYNYSPKVSKSERNKGLSGMEKKKGQTLGNGIGNRSMDKTEPKQNHHPTVKPISLLRRILSYFKTPNEQIVLDCFVGSGSLPIACIEENMNFIGYELDSDYFEIAEKRIFAAQQQLKLF